MAFPKPGDVPKPHASPQAGLGPQQGKEMSRLKADLKVWAGGLCAPGPLHWLHQPPSLLFRSLLIHPTEEGCGDPAGAELWGCDGGPGGLQSGP